MLTNTEILAALGQVNPMMLEQFNIMAGARRQGDTETLFSALCKMQDIKRAFLLGLLQKYLEWQSQAYLPGDGDGTAYDGTAWQLPCPPAVPPDPPTPYPITLAITAECGDGPVQVTLPSLPDFWDTGYLVVLQWPVVGTLTVDLSSWSLWYEPPAGTAASGTFVIKIRDVYGREYTVHGTYVVTCPDEPPPCPTAFFAGGLISQSEIGESPIDPTKYVNIYSAEHILGGTAPFSYLWTVDEELEIHGTTATEQYLIVKFLATFSMLFNTQKAYCTVTDANGCEYEFEITVGYGSSACTPIHIEVDGNTPIEIDIQALDGFQYFTFGLVITTGPSHGYIVIDNAMEGIITYTPVTGYSGSDSFIYGWLSNEVSGVWNNCPVTINVGPPPSGCPEPTMVMQSIFQAMYDPAEVIAGDHLVLMQFALTNVTGIGDITVRIYRADTGALLHEPDLDTWDFDGTTLYGGVSIEDNITIRVEYIVETECGTVRTNHYLTLVWNNPPVANDNFATCRRNNSVMINIIADDYDLDNDSLTIIEIDGQDFDDNVNDTIILAGGKGTVRWGDATHIEYEAPVDTEDTFVFGYMIRDNPANPLLSQTAGADITVTVQEFKCTGQVLIVIGDITGTLLTRDIEVSLNLIDIDVDHDIEWFLNTGTGYGTAETEDGATEVFTEATARIYSIRAIVTDNAKGCVYVAEINIPLT